MSSFGVIYYLCIYLEWMCNNRCIILINRFGKHECYDNSILKT